MRPQVRRPGAARSAVGAVLACLIPVRAQAAPERWTAASTTARAITGDVTVSPGRIIFRNGASLSLGPVGPTTPALAVRTVGGARPATLYRVVPPADPVLLNGNRLCGGPGRPRPVTFLALWESPAPGGGRPWREMAAFSGAAAPASEGDACATYGYVPR